MAKDFADAATYACAAAEAYRDLPSATRLRALAKRYRLLSETLVSPDVIEAVQACARELESEAALIEKNEARPPHEGVP